MICMDLIEKFISNYEKEYDSYTDLAVSAKTVLENEIFNRGIKAIVTFRTKRLDSLYEKLIRRNEKKKYSSLSDIENDIVDRAGVRVALYFPSDRKILNRAIEELFVIKLKKEFPYTPQKIEVNKRFSGYWASHYRVRLKNSGSQEVDLTSKIVEIQVASVLMHAWSEVEHDLVYKPLSGNVSEDELAILDEINGLVMAGEIALERLQKAYAERTKRNKEITDRYQLSMLVLNNFKNLDLTKVELGDTSLLNHYLQAVSKMDTDEVLKSFEKVNLNYSESVTDQILMDIISKDYDNNLIKYLTSFTKETETVIDYFIFLKVWIILEKAILRINEQNQNIPVIKSLAAFPIYEDFLDFTEEESSTLKQLRILRNKLLHGYNSITNMEMDYSTKKLKEITSDLILKINDQKLREKLNKRLRKTGI